MSLLLSLPSVVGKILLSEWIELKELAKLDTAVCQSRWREDFLILAFTSGGSAYSSAVYVEEKTEEGKIDILRRKWLMDWVVARNIAVTAIVIDADFLAKYQARLQWLITTGTKVTDVTIFTSKFDLPRTNEVLQDVCLKCPNVQNVSCSMHLDATSFRLICSHWPGLEGIVFGENVPNKFFRFVANHCKSLKSISCTLEGEGAMTYVRECLQSAGHHTLERFSVKNVSFVGELFETVAHECPHLQSLSVECSDEAELGDAESDDEGFNTAAGLDHVLSSCVNLTEFDFSCMEFEEELLEVIKEFGNRFTVLKLKGLTSDLPKDTITRVMEQCHNVKVLHLSKLDVRADRVLLAVGTNCPMLEDLEIWEDDNYCPGDVGICAIASGCPLLRRLSAGVCVMKQRGFKALEDGCPHLRHLDILFRMKYNAMDLLAVPVLCARLRELHLFPGDMTLDSLALLAATLSSVRVISINRMSLFTGAYTLEQVRALFKPSVRVLLG